MTNIKRQLELSILKYILRKVIVINARSIANGGLASVSNYQDPRILRAAKLLYNSGHLDDVLQSSRMKREEPQLAVTKITAPAATPALGEYWGNEIDCGI